MNAAVSGVFNDTRSKGCNVTRPNASTPPNQQPATTWHGNDVLWTRLGVDGAIMPDPEEMSADGQIEIDDWPWVTADPAAKLSIEGKVISSANGEPTASGGHLLGIVPDADGSGVFRVRMHFSQPGCREITGTAPEGSLTVTVLILPPAAED